LTLRYSLLLSVWVDPSAEHSVALIRVNSLRNDSANHNPRRVRLRLRVRVRADPNPGVDPRVNSSVWGSLFVADDWYSSGKAHAPIKTMAPTVSAIVAT